MRFILLSIVLLTFSTVFSQDIIVTKKGDEIKSKILEVGITIVKYKKYDNQTGPMFEMLKSDIFMIKYQNGTKDVFNEEPAKEVTVKPTEPAPVQKSIFQKKEVTPKIGEQVKEPKKLSYTENHNSTSLLYGLSAFLGLGGFTSSDGDGGSFDMNSYAIGPVILMFNKAINENLSGQFGPSVMYYRQGYSYTEGYYSGSRYYTKTVKGGINLAMVGFSGGLNYHFATTDKIDPYAGVGAGVGYYTAFGDGESNWGGSLKGSVPILYGARVGVNIYNKNPNSGAFTVEAGFDYLSYLKVGYTFVKKR